MNESKGGMHTPISPSGMNPFPKMTTGAKNSNSFKTEDCPGKVELDPLATLLVGLDLFVTLLVGFDQLFALLVGLN